MNKLTTVYFLLLLSPLINAKLITMEVHKVPLVDVLYELAEAAQGTEADHAGASANLEA